MSAIGIDEVLQRITNQPQTSRQIAGLIYGCDPASVKAGDLDPVSKALSYLKKTGKASSRNGVGGITFWFEAKAKAAVAEKIEAALHNRVVPASEADEAGLALIAISGALEPIRKLYPNQSLIGLVQIAVNHAVELGELNRAVMALSARVTTELGIAPGSSQYWDATLSDDVEALLKYMSGLRDTLAATQQTADDYAKQVTGWTNRHEEIDKAFRQAHAALDDAGIEPDHIVTRIKELASRVKSQPSQAVASDDNIIPSNKNLHLDESPAISAYLIELAGKVLTRQSELADSNIYVTRPDDRVNGKPIQIDDIYHCEPVELPKLLDALTTLREART
jgi:hypothetical protein